MSVVVAELPGLYLDNGATEASPARLLVANRNPEPNQTDVAADALIAVDLIDTGAVPGINLSITRVRLNGVLAYDGGLGGFQAGYDGVGSSVQTPAANVRRITIDTVAVFDSQLVVTVAVASATTDAVASISPSYTFTVADTTPPRLLTVDARNIKLLRVAFNEPVGDSALVPGNYSLAGAVAGIPVMPTLGARVTRVSSTVVDLTTTYELSFGARYTLTASNILDAWGNAIVAPYAAFTFTAIRPPGPPRRSFDLWKMIPNKNRSEDDGTLRKFILCLQDCTDLLLYLIDKWADTLDVDYAPEGFADAMLRDLGNPFTDFNLTLAEKRRLARILVAIYKSKGTGPGVINVINFFLSLTVTISPYIAEGMSLGESELGYDWILGIGTRAGKYSFDVVSGVGLTADQRAKIRRIVDYMKPAHTHFINLLEPVTPVTPNHMILGESQLGGAGAGNEGNWTLH